MGLPNLRQAKEALKPEWMEEKFTAHLIAHYIDKVNEN